MWVHYLHMFILPGLRGKLFENENQKTGVHPACRAEMYGPENGLTIMRIWRILYSNIRCARGI